MKLQEMTWQEVDALPRDVVVVIPTGSLEQHGPHLSLFTDSVIVTAVAEAAEAVVPNKVLLTPTLWLGASQHHLAFAGSLSNTFDGYVEAIKSVVQCLAPHGFAKFFVLNGHGGNQEPNGIAMRTLKSLHPNLAFAHAGYFEFCREAIAQSAEGPLKQMSHACEAETSLMQHLRPDLVRTDLIRDDGLRCDPPVAGLVSHFDEITEEGSRGYASFANPEKGKRIFEAAVEGTVRELSAMADGYVFSGPLIG